MAIYSMGMKSMRLRIFIITITILIIGCGARIHMNNDIQANGKIVSSPERFAQVTDSIMKNHSFEKDLSIEVFSNMLNTTTSVPFSELRFSFSERGTSFWQIIEVAEAPRGAIAKYFFAGECPCWDAPPDPYCEPLSVFWASECHPLIVELNEDEWHDFFNTLYNSSIKDWREKDYRDYGTYGDYGWTMDIFTVNGDTLISSHSNEENAPNWSEFRSVINDLRKTIEDKIDKRLDTGYAKRFGRPMSEYERTVKEISYFREGKLINVTLTKAGLVTYRDGLGSGSIEHNLRDWLDLEDWFDIVNALGNDAIDIEANPESDYIYVNFAPKHKARMQKILSKYRESEDVDSINDDDWGSKNDFEPLAVSAEFKKVMDGIRAKIKKDLIIENE